MGMGIFFNENCINCRLLIRPKKKISAHDNLSGIAKHNSKIFGPLRAQKIIEYRLLEESSTPLTKNFYDPPWKHDFMTPRWRFRACTPMLHFEEHTRYTKLILGFL